MGGEREEDESKFTCALKGKGLTLFIDTLQIRLSSLIPCSVSHFLLNQVKTSLALNQPDVEAMELVSSPTS